MELSKRLNFIVKHVDKCDVVADIGTDHGYIPIYLAKNNICSKVIASDINKEPLAKCKLNAIFEGVDDRIDGRLGNGLSILSPMEAKGVVIAGMGGNLIRDILEENMNIVESFDFIILQPAQNPEVLREYLYTSGFEIIEEDICEDDGIFYELFKVKRDTNMRVVLQDLFYEISPRLLQQKHPLMKEYLKNKRGKYVKILSFITDESESAKLRKATIEDKLSFIEGLINSI